VLDRLRLKINESHRNLQGSESSETHGEDVRQHRRRARRLEEYLDSGSGACWLSNSKIAAVVADALRHFNCSYYWLHAWCVMPNHVHVLLEPLPGHPLSDILHSWKSFSAKEANRILYRSGPFWQREYYDHLIRNSDEFTRAVRYVSENPEKAGLRNWPWVWVART
jgi:REP element-mobilizing transposase RayT